MKKQMKRFATLFAAMMLVLVTSISCFADTEEYEKDSAGNYFAAGDNVTIEGDGIFSGYAAGANVSATGANFEDGIAFAGAKINVTDVCAGSSAYLAGNSIEVKDSFISGNVLAAGSIVSIDDGSYCNAALLFGNTVEFSGTTNSIIVAGNRVVIDGTINGDAIIEGDDVIIGENAVIDGAVTITADKEPQISDSATMGEYKFNKITTKEAEGQVKRSVGAVIVDKIKSAIYWSLAMVLVGLVMCWLMKKQLLEAGIMVKERTGIMLGTGAIVLLVTPIAAIIALFTVIGIPVTLLVMTIYIVLCCIAIAFSGASIGRFVFSNLNPVLASIISIVILEFVKVIPIVGGFVSLAACIYTLGYFVQAIYLGQIRKEQ